MLASSCSSENSTGGNGDAGGAGFGVPATGGTLGTGGTPGAGGATATGGTTTVGGATATGGTTSTGGATGTGGTAGTAGTTEMGGTAGTGGETLVEGPCDIYATANTPCVAAHSTVRALYGAYSGNLYQLRRASDGATEEVPVLAPGGFADISVQDAFCAGTSCTISIIYDQTENHNDLPKSPPALWLPDGGNEANAAEGEITVSGHTVHGIYVTGYSTDVGYRATATTGIATGDEAEAMYMVVDGTRYSDQCCFDYGNATPSGNADGNGTMEAIYFWGRHHLGGPRRGRWPVGRGRPRIRSVQERSGRLAITRRPYAERPIHHRQLRDGHAQGPLWEPLHAQGRRCAVRYPHHHVGRTTTVARLQSQEFGGSHHSGNGR